MKAFSNTLSTLLMILFIVISLEAQVKFSEKTGGNNGEIFMIPANRSDILTVKEITGVAIQYTNRVESIVLEYKNTENENQIDSIGNNAGQWSYIDLEKGEFITYITGKAGTLIDQITFHTSQRRTFGPYGGNGGQDFEINIPSNAIVIGFTGKAGPSINQLGLIYRLMNTENDEVTDNVRIVRDHRTEKKSNESLTEDDDTIAPKRIVRDHRIEKKSSVKDPRTKTSSFKFISKNPIKAIEQNSNENITNKGLLFMQKSDYKVTPRSISKVDKSSAFSNGIMPPIMEKKK